MITDSIKKFVERFEYALVASADRDGLPHLAAGRELEVPDHEHLVFRAWFCETTLANLRHNPQLSVVVVDPSSGNGFQFVGRADKIEDAAFLDGLAPGEEPPALPQVQSRLVVLVQKVMLFSPVAHSDRQVRDDSE